MLMALASKAGVRNQDVGLLMALASEAGVRKEGVNMLMALASKAVVKKEGQEYTCQGMRGRAVMWSHHGPTHKQVWGERGMCVVRAGERQSLLPSAWLVHSCVHTHTHARACTCVQAAELPQGIRELACMHTLFALQ